MVKIVSSDDEESRDKIIKSTNSQNPVQKASLRATDKIQRQIELMLKSNQIYYDRRKNYYKNKGIKPDQIITIPRLSQALMAIVLKRPNDARARPSNIISKDEDYRKLFSESYPIDLYLVVAKVFKKVESRLRVHDTLSARDRNNIQFYVLNFALFTLLGTTSPKAGKIAKLNLDLATDAFIDTCITAVWGEFHSQGAEDQLAKGSEFKNDIETMAADEIENKLLFADL